MIDFGITYCVTGILGKEIALLEDNAVGCQQTE